jgi:hypothetical protein
VQSRCLLASRAARASPLTCTHSTNKDYGCFDNFCAGIQTLTTDCWTSRPRPRAGRLRTETSGHESTFARRSDINRCERCRFIGIRLLIHSPYLRSNR